jgi:choline-sulfatase
MPATADRPNLLVIMSDEHDPGVMGCYGDEIVDTAHLDGLADRGVTFDNCYANSPLCVPSRLSFTAGQYVSRCSAWSNKSWLPSDDYPTLPRAMADAGYESLLAGKMHYDETRSYGFTELFDGPQNTSYKRGKIVRRAPDDESVNTGSWHTRSSNFYVGDDAYPLEWDREVTQEVTTFLRDRDPDDDPFFMLAGYIAPHFPLVTPFEYYEKYQGQVSLPEIPKGALETLPINYDQIRRGFGVTNVDHEGDKVRFARELYWAFVDWFDDQVGQLLDALDDSAVSENTVVIYTSDHGENKGDHGMWWKNCMYDHGVKVPLIVSWPERWAGGERRTEVCSLVDLVATIADIGGAEALDQWDGDSLLGLLDDPATEWKDFALSEYYAHYTVSGFTMYREGRYKYVYHARHEDHGPEVELYDMETDPEELNNLADDEAYADIRDDLHEAMIAELGEHPDDIEQRARLEAEEGYDRE